MLKKIVILLAILLLTTPAWALDIKLQWADNSTNEDGFVIERRIDADAGAEIGKTAANVAVFSDLAPVTGKKHTYRVSAFNAGGKSTPSNEVAVMDFANYPVTLQGSVLPEQGVIAVTLSMPKGATESKLQMKVFDADQANEGQLFINGNGPIALFPAPLGGDGVESTVTIPVPVSYWREGENRLWFVHLSGAGYAVRGADVFFVVPLLAPSGLKIIP